MRFDDSDMAELTTVVESAVRRALEGSTTDVKPRAISESDLAKACGVSKRLVEDFRKHGKLVPHRDKRPVLYKVEAIDQLMDLLRTDD